MMRVILPILLMLLAACAIKPPVQEMSNARAAIKMAQGLPGSTENSEKVLNAAETALGKASEAVDQKRYDYARSKALEARRHAQRAARLKQVGFVETSSDSSEESH